MSDACLLSCDWGSTSFRLRAVTAEGAVRAERRSPRGTSAVSAEVAASGRAARFAEVLGEEIAALEADGGIVLTGLPVVVSGMATSAHGWLELPYAVAPLPLDGTGLTTARRQVRGHEVTLVSGIRTECDVMRGEECELLGLLRARPACARGDWAVILPGTHAKHVLLEEGSLADFSTAMSGELFAVLKEHTVLRHSFAPERETGPEQGLDEVFLEGLLVSYREGLCSALFQVRARTLLANASAAASRAYLNGTLLGDELRDESILDWRQVLIGAAGQRAEHYRKAVEVLCPDATVYTLDEAELDQLVVLGHLALEL